MTEGSENEQPTGPPEEETDWLSDSDAPPPPPVGELSDDSNDGQPRGSPNEDIEWRSDSDGLPPPPVGELSEDEDDNLPPQSKVTAPMATRPSFRALNTSLSPPQISNPPLTPPGSPGRVIAELDGIRDRLRQVHSHAATLAGVQKMLNGTVESRLESAPQRWESYNRMLSIRGRQLREAWEAHGEE